jgi:hypothetical protein
LGGIPTHLFEMNSCGNTIRAAIDRAAFHGGPGHCAVPRASTLVALAFKG